MRDSTDESHEDRQIPRVVLDTNIYVSGTILSHGAPFEVLEAWRRQAYILLTSEAIIAEVERVLRYPHIRDRYGISDEDVRRLIASLRTDALVVPGVYEVRGVVADPDDDKFVACALEGQADCIVTGDTDLLDLVRYRGIDVLRPSEFLKRLEMNEVG
jgi:putative PIN family toxin of toxin-antitoxin system